MLKKSFTVVIIFMFLFMASALGAEGEVETATPEDPLFDTVRSLEDAQYDLAEDEEEKVALQDEFAERRLDALDEMEEAEAELIEEVLEDYMNHERELGQILEGMDGPNAEALIALVDKASEKRGQRLAQNLEREDLPEEAREGMQRALANQEMAREKMKAALERAQNLREAAKEAGQERGDDARKKAEEFKEQGRNMADQVSWQGRNNGNGEEDEREDNEREDNERANSSQGLDRGPQTDAGANRP